MKIRLILALLAANTILLGGCASTSNTSDAQSSSATAEMAAFQKSYDSTEMALEKAASVGGEWRDTGKIMKSAKAAADTGDFTKAQKLIDTAMFQAEMGYEQAMNQRDAGPHY